MHVFILLNPQASQKLGYLIAKTRQSLTSENVSRFDALCLSIYLSIHLSSKSYKVRTSQRAFFVTLLYAFSKCINAACALFFFSLELSTTYLIAKIWSTHPFPFINWFFPSPTGFSQILLIKLVTSLVLTEANQINTYRISLKTVQVLLNILVLRLLWDFHCWVSVSFIFAHFLVSADFPTAFGYC